MIEKDFILHSYNQLPTSGRYTWKSPSNIALVKYWGKKENQIPANPSISFTLDACATTTDVTYRLLEKEENDFSFDLFFEGNTKESFKPKIQQFLKRILVYCPYLKNYHFKIETSNSFPHSSGIASSASGMSALALCLMSLEKEINPEITLNYFNQKASFLGNLVVWGDHATTKGSSNLIGVKYPYEVHPVFEKFHDTILLVDKGKKQVSSTLGHELMNGHPFAKNRFEQAHANLSKLQEIFKKGDLKAFIEIVESEALTLHAMMMTSLPYFILMQPNTLQIIHKIWAFREKMNLHICFTLDAGANVHVLYPEFEKELVFEFIKNELVAYCENGHYICDRIGFGAKQVVANI